MASNFASLALFLWPVVVFFLFRARPLDEALVWSIIGGYLLLPQYSAFDLPMLPPWNKALVPSLAAAVMCYTMVRMDAVRSARPALARASNTRAHAAIGLAATEFKVRRGNMFFWALLIVLFGSPFITSVTNSEPIVEEFRFVQGMRFYDSLSVNLKLLVNITPFLLARRFLSSSESHLVLLKVFVLIALAYSLLALWEVRMSPRLHKDIYGFFPHRWGQHVRYGGYRPVVFLNHGLWVAILFAMGTVGAMALWREKLKRPNQKATIWFLSSIYLFVVLVLCKSAGAILIAVLLLPVAFLLGLRLQLLIATIIISIILVYPALRGADVVPVNAIYSSVAKIDKERADSLQIRFDAEDKLLARANRKPWAGWGSWGRNRVTQEKGEAFTATDGYWAIVVGVYGWLGYVAQFSLLGGATILLAFNRRRFDVTPATAGLALILVVAMIDLIPNATISPIVWLLAGAMMGRYQTAQATAPQTQQVRARADAPDRRPSAEPENATATVSTPAPAPRPMHRRQPRKG